MTRVTLNPRRDLSKPLVEVDASAPRAEKIGAWALRNLMPVLILAGIVKGAIIVALLFVLAR